MRRARALSQGRPRLRPFAVAVLAALAALTLGSAPGRAVQWQEFAIWSFCQGSPCNDGLAPQGGIIISPDGDLWGTTLYGGKSDAGTVFSLTMPGTLEVQVQLHSFCATPGKNFACPDGALPMAGLAQGRLGYFFGTTYDGGKGGPASAAGTGGGTVFEVLPGEGFKTVHNFCVNGGLCADGTSPAYNLLANAFGTAFFGTTTSGGGRANAGTAFKVTSAGGFKTLYHFCSATACRDGETPSGPLISDSGGNLYGTTSSGGAHGQGTVFKLSPSGVERVLYSFCSLSSCTDGQQPSGKLLRDNSGNIYGTAPAGGAHGGGVVFKIDANDNETVLYSFCPGGAPCVDGSSPSAGVVLSLSGTNLYGTTVAGGNTDHGTVFAVPIAGGSESVIYSFCPTGEPVCADGATPSGPLVMDNRGDLFGTTDWGGSADTTNQTAGGGTVFELVNPAPGT